MFRAETSSQVSIHTSHEDRIIVWEAGHQLQLKVVKHGEAVIKLAVVDKDVSGAAIQPRDAGAVPADPRNRANRAVLRVSHLADTLISAVEGCIL